MAQALLVITLSGFIILLALTVIALVRDPDLHVWPSVTRCRICEKRVYAWQRQDFRPYVVRFDDPDELIAGREDQITASGIVHRQCKGKPTVTLSVRRRPACDGAVRWSGTSRSRDTR